MTSFHKLVSLIAVLIFLSGLVESSAHSRLEVAKNATRRECFASNERITKTWATSPQDLRGSLDLNHCDWR